jgi:uncharacterized protein YbbC (DUF1343 family)
MSQFVTGLERVIANPEMAKSWGRCGLVANQASVTSQYKTAWTELHRILGPRLVALFGPQHGFYGTKQDNMIETNHTTFGTTGLPLYSLYSETREPTGSMLENLDTIVVDLQIVGCRIYTWKATIAGCLRAAKKHGKKIVILDRPNPVGGELCEGRVLDPDCTSFVGEYPIPMRHGLTSAEAARFFNQWIQADLEWVSLQHWNPASYWSDFNRPWVLTSPNLPTIDPVYVYPGTVMLEGTMLSEGRGTGLPFQFVGAPFIPSEDVFKETTLKILGGDAPGVFLRPCQFEPTAQKWRGETCKGFQIHVVDPSRIRSFDFTIALIRAAFELSDGKFKWKEPPYEYDLYTLPMKLIFGNREIDSRMQSARFSIEDSYWHFGIQEYLKQAEKILIYPRMLRQASRSFETN